MYHNGLSLSTRAEKGPKYRCINQPSGMILMMNVPPFKMKCHHGRAGHMVAWRSIFQCLNRQGYNAGRHSATKGPYLHELSPD